MALKAHLNQSMTSKVGAFFDDRASNYNHDSERFPWRYLRKAEGRQMMAVMGDLDGKIALDLGCGAGFFSRRLLEQGARRVVAVDFSANMISRLPDKGVKGVVGDIATVDLGQKFERIICAGVLEFLPDPGAVLRNARAHAVRGGRLGLLVPERNIWGRLYRAYHRNHGFIINLFAASDIDRLAMESGWRQIDSRSVIPFTRISAFEAI